MSCSSDNSLSDEPAPPTTVIEYQYLELNQWIYEQMNHDYLWREDLPDSLECDYGLFPSDFFKSLLSSKDRFSYLTSNPYYSQPSEYGFAFQKYNMNDQHHFYEVLYIKNPELRKQGMRRGDLVDISSSNGFHIYTKLHNKGNALLNSGITFREPITTRRNGDTSSVLLDSVYYINDRKIGYICYLEFDKISDLGISLRKLYNCQIDELIVDLRYNPGGYVNTCRYLCNCILPSEAYDEVFQKCRYNNIISEDYMKSTGLPYTISLYQTPPSIEDNVLGTSIVPLNQKKVYFLTSSHTASASEATIICLRPYMEVIVIGETTVGKGVGSWTIYDPKYKYAIQPITLRYYNALDETTPDGGLHPDYFVSDGALIPKKEIGETDELLLSTALDIISGHPNKGASFLLQGTLNTLDKVCAPIGEPSFITDFRNKRHYP